MERTIEHRRTPEGTLVIVRAGAEAPALSAGFQEVLDTRTPHSRRNYLRLALRFANARIAQGVDPETLLEMGPALFRAKLETWHKNESGRFAWDWDNKRVTVFLDDQEDEDVTEALNGVLNSHFESSRRKYLPFLLSFINFVAERGERPLSFMTESTERVRYRMNRWLGEELELIVDVLNGQPDSSIDVRSENGPINHKALGIAAIRQLYGVLSKSLCVRTGPNPIDIDGLDEMSYQDKLDLARTKYGLVKRLPKYFGSQYAVKGRTNYAPIPHDPLQTYPVLKSAVDELGRFPAVLEDVLTIMDCEGPRHHDIRRKAFDAWAPSRFGDWMYGDNKASSDPKYKRIVFGGECAAQMRRRVDAQHIADPCRPENVSELIARVERGVPVRPSMAQLEELLDGGRMDILVRIPMFPSSLDRPYSYGGWNYWIRLATDQANGGAGARIATSVGPVRPTAVWLRRSMFTERVLHAASTTSDPKELKVQLDVIRGDAGHRSPGAIFRYVDSILPGIFVEPQRARAAESRARMAAERAGIPLPTANVPPPPPMLSPKSRGLRGRARP